MSLSYCLHCKKQTTSINAINTVRKSGKHMQLTNCDICGRKRSRFAKSSGNLDNILADENFDIADDKYIVN